jgi:tripartite-type tricarboxylate transporter receptor subunit TctC
MRMSADSPGRHAFSPEGEDALKVCRRRFLQLAAGAAAMPAVPRLANAQAYPSRPVRWIVPFGAGNPPDIVARSMAQWLSERLGQAFVIENRPGAGGTIAMESVVRAPADGHTLITMAPSSVINAVLFSALYEKLNINVVRDVAPVATFTRQAQVMVVNPSLPATVPEFIAYAKANPGKITMASNGTGTGQHVAGELFKMMAGVDMVHVPYRGGASAIADLIAGRVQVMFTSPFGLVEYVRAGKLRALAVTTAIRSEALPDVPPVGDFLPGYEVIAWFGVGAPINTPPEVVEKLNKEINAALADPGMTSRISDMGATPFGSSPADFNKFFADEAHKWAKVVKFAGIKAQ